MPDWIVPMAATLTQQRFSGPEWLFERKLDGIRMLAFKQGQAVRLLSRNRLPLEASYPSVGQAIAALPAREVILDGEATWGGGHEGAYHVFDMPWLDGRDLRRLPLQERRALLQRLPLHRPLAPVVALDSAQPWQQACDQGWEGVIAKRRDSPYEHRRSPHWLKMKCELSREFVVGGFTDPRGRRLGLGAVLVGYFEGQEFVFAGKVGTGFDTRLLGELRARLAPLEIPRPPFTRAVGLPRAGVHWVIPRLVVQVAFIEWTVYGKLRHPRLLGVRWDQQP